LAYKIVFKKSVSKDLKKLDTAIAGEILKKIESEIFENVDKFPALKGKFTGLRKFRIGDYRVLFTIIKPKTALILRVAHRKEVYKK
jgi:mRNA interferase RelE/StbE